MPAHYHKRKANGQFAKKSHKKKGSGHKRRRRQSDGFGGLGSFSLNIPKGLGSDSLEFLKIRNRAAGEIGQMKRQIAIAHLEAKGRRLSEAYAKQRNELEEQKKLAREIGHLFAV